MNRKTLFITSMVVLIAILSVTVASAAATFDLLSRSDSSGRTIQACSDLPSRYSIHSKYVEGAGWVTYTEDGPTGVDGGLVDLLASYRHCSE